MASTHPTLEFERPHLIAGRVVVGIDEVGRGAIAGPVMVGAVALARDPGELAGLNDSKLLTAKRREGLVDPIKQWADAWAIGSASAQEIDAWGIALALAVAANRAIEALSLVPEHLLIDGPHNILRCRTDVQMGVELPPLLTANSIPATMLVKGDQRSMAIAAAAVLAKVARDAIMVELAGNFPEFEWDGNKGYGSSGHLEALTRIGPTSHHRQSWNIPQGPSVEG